MHDSAFAPGFRLSTLDVTILVVGLVTAAVLALMTWWWGFVIAFVLAHFFLFCNVIRMARPLELAWGAIFLILAGATVASDTPGWVVTAIVSLVATLVLVGIEMWKPSYHGIGWQHINPGLVAWWDAQQARRGSSDGVGG